LSRTHGGRRDAAAPEVGGGSAKRRAASGGGSERQSSKSVSRRDEETSAGGRQRQERGLGESRDEVECRVAGVDGMNAWPAGRRRAGKKGRQMRRQRERRKEVLGRPQSGGNKARWEKDRF